MATVDSALRPDGTEFERLKAESSRLRADFLRLGLDITYTIARFPEAKPGSQVLEETCRTAARLGCSRLERMLAQAGPAEDELAEKLSQLRAALEGEKSEELAETVGHTGNNPTEEHRSPAELRVAVHTLTRREQEVLKYIAEGNSTKEVASILGITFKTAACHRYRVMDKLGIHETANLVRYAIRQGMVQA